MARQKHVPTDQQREMATALAGGGIPQTLIARAIGISVPTLEREYRVELDTGKTRITGKAISTLIRAMDSGGKGAVGAAAFWLKCREGWKETSALEVAGKDGVPLFPVDSIRNYMKTVADDEE